MEELQKYLPLGSYYLESAAAVCYDCEPNARQKHVDPAKVRFDLPL